MSPAFWESLSIGRKKRIEKALVSPRLRISTASLDIINFPETDLSRYCEEYFLNRLNISDEIARKIQNQLLKTKL